MEAFGHDKRKAEQHWFEYGFNEKRNPLPEGEEVKGADSDDDTASIRSDVEERRESEQYGESIGSLTLSIVYSPPPESNPTEPTSAPIAITNEDTPTPPIICKACKSNTISHVLINYDVWSGTDLFKHDGFVDNMFDVVNEYYEGDPIGPSTKSSLDAPPVNCVRSIYGINVPTEVGAIYRKVPVVTIGDNNADSRYMVDQQATFEDGNIDFTSQYDLNGGIIMETRNTLQNVPGKEEPRRCCGDGTVPYWNMAHAMTWKDEVDELTIDELEGAVHRDIIADERFFALLKRYCQVIDPRANAMLMMKGNYSGGQRRGISTLSRLSLGDSSAD